MSIFTTITLVNRLDSRKVINILRFFSLSDIAITKFLSLHFTVCRFTISTEEEAFFFWKYKAKR